MEKMIENALSRGRAIYRSDIMRKKRYFQNLYNFEVESNKYLVTVLLHDYNDIYDDWDPSPFKRRDIEDEFNDFVLNSSEDIPLTFDISIVLYLPEAKKDERKERVLISAYKNYYEYATARISKSISGLHTKILSYLLFSCVFLIVGYFLSETGPGVFARVLHEGILIGGWVFLWEFFTNFFIKRRELLEEFRLYNRLYHAEIRFVYQH
jgi:hypothetical protein